jgi:hypothetical protein
VYRLFSHRIHLSVNPRTCDLLVSQSPKYAMNELLNDGDIEAPKINIAMLRHFVRDELEKNHPPPVNNVINAVNYLTEIPTISGNSSSMPIEKWLNRFESIALCANWDDSLTPNFAYKIDTHRVRFLSTTFAH